MKNIEIDEKKYNIPENFDEISFGDFEELLIMMEKHPSSPTITHDLVLDVIQFLCKIDRNLMIKLPNYLYNYIYSVINFVFYHESLKNLPLKYEFLINNEKFVINAEKNCSTKEYIDRDEVLKNFPDENKLSGMVAIFLRPIGQSYDSNDLLDRISLIKKEKTTVIYPLIAFFLSKSDLLNKTMKVYSMALHLYQQKTQELDSFLKSGDGTGSLLNWRVKICKNLMNSLNVRFSKSLTYYHTLQTRILQAKTN